MSRHRTVGRPGSTWGWRSAVAGILSALIVLVGVTPAHAAGPAVLSVELTPVDPATGAVVTSTGFNQHGNRLAYRIGYSCSVAECTDAVVTLPAIGTDPTYGQFRLHDYLTWTPPAGGGATITTSPTAGITVRLGTIPAGTSSTFQVVYQRHIDTSAPNVVPASYFPDGYQITRSATISSPNAVADVTASSANVTWRIGVPAGPSIVKTGAATVRPDTDVSYAIGMSDGCMFHRGSGRWTSNGSVVCAETYTVVDRLPAQAVFVSASDGGQYDSATHTVTWTESGPGAAGGWGAAATSNWTQWQPWGYNNRTVTVRYPASAFPEGAGGADFVVPVTNEVDVSVTYLDDAATTRTAANSFRHDVVRVEPFGRADQSKIGNADQDTQGTRYVNVPPDTTGIVCPASGRDEWNRVCTAGQPVTPFTTRTDLFWRVDTYNRGNVPGVATVVDDQLGNSSVRVRRIVTSGGTGAPTIEWTATDGTTPSSGTVTATSLTAPAGTWFTSARITSGTLAGPNLLPSGTAGTLFRVDFGYDLPVGSPLFTWTNQASATMTYPGQPQITPIPVTSTASVIFRELPKVAATPPAFSASFAAAPVVEGGGLVVPGGRVAFTLRGATANIPADRDVSPQYVFLAPAGWTVVPNSASFPAGSVPPGVTFTTKTVTVAGVARQAVIASWPTGATFGRNATWPTMTVVASPTASVVAGTQSVAHAWAGDSRNAYGADTTTWGGKVLDAPDVDGDGNVTEAFASGASPAVQVSGTDRLDVLKEICVVRSDGGCTWVANPDIVVGVSPGATDIGYRVTLTNGSNTTLSEVVAYDVLPHLGDGRGSTFATTLNSLGSTSPIDFTFSDSTTPCRPEVAPGLPGCVDDWTADASGAQAIRAELSGALLPGQSVSFAFTARVVEGAPADAIACNSVQADTASTPPGGPLAVCATTQEADLSLTVPDRLPLQAGRPGTVPFTVTNLGGSVGAPASVELAVPAGIRITSLTPAGWLCAADSTAPDGSVLGPVTLTCDAVDEAGAARSLALDVPEPLDLPAVIPDDLLAGEEVCFPGIVSGLMSDPVLENNDASACFTVAAAESLLGLTKDDGTAEASIGDELTYTLDVANLLAGEAVGVVTLTDVLPEAVAFVSASDGGTVSGQGEPDAGGNLPGGTVTWTLGPLAPGGIAGPDGETSSGAPGSTATVTVTVRVLQAAEELDELENIASAAAADPASPDSTLTASAADVDALVHSPALTVVKTADASTFDTVGETVTFGFRVTNVGDVNLTDVSVVEGTFTGSGTLGAVTCSATTLAPSAWLDCSADYQVEQADLDRGSISNTATATAEAPAGLPSPSSAPSTAVLEAVRTATLSLVKSASPTDADAAGEEIAYSFVVTNTGNVTLTAVEIVEGAFTGSGDLSAIECPAGPVAPTESATCTGTYELTQADVDAGSVSNTATATASAPTGMTDPVSSASTALVTITPDASLSVVKSASPGTLIVDDTVTYSFVVTNTGNVTLTGVGIDETGFTGSGAMSAISCDAAASSLAPDAQAICSATYVITQADVDAASLANTAVATAGSPVGEVTSLPSTVTLPIEQEPGVGIVKTADVAGISEADEDIRFTFRVTNSGNVTMSDVEVVEGEFTGSGLLGELTCPSSTLLPGQFVDCAADYTITQEDVDAGGIENTASAEALAPGATEPIASDDSTVELPFIGPMTVALEKTGAGVDSDGDGLLTDGDRIQWRFTVTNTGAATLSELVVDDPTAGTVTCEVTTLAPGESAECAAADHTITAGDASAGRVVNVASATAFGVADTAVTSEDATATVLVTARPLANTGSEALRLLVPGFLVLLLGIGLLLTPTIRRRMA